VNEFLESLARAFARNRDTLPRFTAAVALLVTLALGWEGARLFRRRRARLTLAREVARQHGLSKSDLLLAERLARSASTELVGFLTRLEVFERTTADALVRREEGGESLNRRIRRLRSLLGFDPPPSHMPLLSTRELALGTAIEVGSQVGITAEIDEGSFSVSLREPIVLSKGAEVSLALVHGREARYALRCAVLSTGATEHGWILVLAHDEAPERIQMREYVRIPMKGPILLRKVVSGLASSVETRAAYGALLDVSGGGARLTSGLLLPVGQELKVSFAVAESHFAELRAVVLSCSPTEQGAYQAQLEFRGLREGERARLVSALARFESSQNSDRVT